MHEQSTHKRRFTGPHAGFTALSAEQLAKQIAVAWGTNLLQNGNTLDGIDEALCQLDPRLCKAPITWRQHLARAIEKRLGLRPNLAAVPDLTTVFEQ